MRFQELWSTEPLLRLATLDTVMETAGNEWMIPHVPDARPVSLLSRPEVPDYFEQRRPDILRVRQEFIVNPQNILPDFQLSPIDEAEHMVARTGRSGGALDEMRLMRPVGTVALPREISGVGDFIDFLARLAAYFPSQGFRAENPHDLYRQWCVMEDVQPVATPSPRPVEQERQIVRLGRIFAGYDVDISRLDVVEIVDRIQASSSSGRSFHSHMRALTEQVHRVAHYAGAVPPRGALIDADEVALRAFLPLAVIEDLRAYAMRNNPRTVLDPPVDIHATLTREVFDGEASIGAADIDRLRPTPARGIVIPIDHPGRRHINVENQHETSDTFDAPDRLHAHRQGSRGRDARRPRRPLGLDD